MTEILLNIFSQLQKSQCSPGKGDSHQQRSSNKSRIVILMHFFAQKEVSGEPEMEDYKLQVVINNLQVVIFLYFTMRNSRQIVMNS